MLDHGTIEAHRHGTERSPEWEKIRHEHIKLDPVCNCCGGKHSLQVHHIWPFHICIALGFPHLELDHKNLITLCEDPKTEHHLLLGHLDDFRSANVNVKEFCKTYKEKEDKEAIKEDPEWQKAHIHRLRPLDELTEQEKEYIKKILVNV